jgi:hypothetical protein
MAANYGAVDHVLPVVGQADVDQRLQKRVPDALFGPATEPDIDRVPLAVTLMHVPPGAAGPQHIQHAVEKQPVIAGRTRPTTAFRRQQAPDDRPFLVSQIASEHSCPPKDSLESDISRLGNPFCQQNLGRALLRHVTRWEETKNPHWIDLAVVVVTEAGWRIPPCLQEMASYVAKRRINGMEDAAGGASVVKEEIKGQAFALM